MQFTKSFVISTAIVAFLALGLCVGGANAAYPEKGKVIHLYVGYGPGGGTDTSARLLAENLEKVLNTTIVVENRPGGGGLAAVQRLIKQEPDGYTLMLGPLPANNMYYLDPERGGTHSLEDLTPIATHDYSVMTVTVAADSKWKTFNQLLDAARQKPKSVTAASSGVLGNGHLSVMLLNKKAGVSINWISFNSSGLIRAALLGHHVDIEMSGLGEVSEPHKSGSVRILAILSENRLPEFKDIPTGRELGVDAISQTTRVLIGPKGLPSEVVNVLDSAVGKLIADPDYQKAAAKRTVQLFYQNAEKTKAFWKEFDVTFKPLVDTFRGR